MKNKLTYYLVDVDNTEKFVFENELGVIEIVKINTKVDRDIFCVPSMYECKLGCKMCYLTLNNISGSNKKVEYSVIKDCLQQIYDSNLTTTKLIQDRQISVMGVGEPLLNLELIFDLCENESRVSIASIFPFIPSFYLPSNLKIHYSLHVTNEKDKKELIPNAKAEIVDVLDFLENHSGNVEIHYTLIENVNDRDSDIMALSQLLRNRRKDLVVKFLDFKTSYKSKLHKSNKLGKFISVLSENDRKVEFYYPPGENIQGSCGLFTEGFYNKKLKDKSEFKLLLKKYSVPI